MKYVRTSFFDESFEFEITVDHDGPDSILISISNEADKDHNSSIWLNIETAVKFSKEIRRKIADVKAYQLKLEKDGE